MDITAEKKTLMRRADMTYCGSNLKLVKHGKYEEQSLPKLCVVRINVLSDKYAPALLLKNSFFDKLQRPMDFAVETIRGECNHDIEFLGIERGDHRRKAGSTSFFPTDSLITKDVTHLIDFDVVTLSPFET
jgi:hypothetical protein